MKYSREELIAMAEVIVDKLKVHRYKKIFTCGALTAGIVGGVAAISSVLPAGSDALQIIGNIAMATNMVAVGANVPDVFKAFIGKDVMQEKIEDFKKGNLTEEKFYENFIKDAVVNYLHMSMDEIEQEVEKKQGRSM